MPAGQREPNQAGQPGRPAQTSVGMFASAAGSAASRGPARPQLRRQLLATAAPPPQAAVVELAGVELASAPAPKRPATLPARYGALGRPPLPAPPPPVSGAAGPAGLMGPGPAAQPKPNRYDWAQAQHWHLMAGGRRLVAADGAPAAPGQPHHALGGLSSAASRVLIVNPMQIVNLSEHTKSRLIKVIEAVKRFSEKWFSHVLLLMFLAVYACLGAYVFISFEAPNEHWEKLQIIELRQRIIQESWQLALKHPDNSSQYAIDFVASFEEYERALARSCAIGVHAGSLEPQWTFWGALFYSMTVFTTIGYGHLTPITFAGRVATMVYAIFGIPILLMVLADLGKLLTRIIKFAFKRFSRLYGRLLRRQASVRTRKLLSSQSGRAARALGEARARALATARKRLQSPLERRWRALCAALSWRRLLPCQRGRPEQQQEQQQQQAAAESGQKPEAEPDTVQAHSSGRERAPSAPLPGPAGQPTATKAAQQTALLVTPPSQSEPVSPVDEQLTAPLAAAAAAAAALQPAQLAEHALLAGSATPQLGLEPPPPPDQQQLKPDEEPPLDELDGDDFDIPVSFALFLLVGYMMLGAVQFSIWEGWNFFDSLYFVFISMSTIGFGDLVPKHPKRMVATFIYLLFGLALTSMCINVVQEKIHATFLRAKMQIGEKIGLDLDHIMADDYYDSQPPLAGPTGDGSVAPAAPGSPNAVAAAAAAAAAGQAAAAAANGAPVAVAANVTGSHEHDHTGLGRMSRASSDDSAQPHLVGQPAEPDGWPASASSRKNSVKAAGAATSARRRPPPANSLRRSSSRRLARPAPAAGPAPTSGSLAAVAAVAAASLPAASLAAGPLARAALVGAASATHAAASKSPGEPPEGGPSEAAAAAPVCELVSAPSGQVALVAPVSPAAPNTPDTPEGHQHLQLLACEPLEAARGPRLTASHSHPSRACGSRSTSPGAGSRDGSTTTNAESIAGGRTSSSSSSAEARRLRRASVSHELGELDDLIRALSKSPSARYAPLLGVPSKSRQATSSPRPAASGAGAAVAVGPTGATGARQTPPNAASSPPRQQAQLRPDATAAAFRRSFVVRPARDQNSSHNGPG